MKHHIKQAVTLFVCLCFIVALLLNTAYLSHVAGHTHPHTDSAPHTCPVCAMIKTTQGILEQLTRAAATVLLSFTLPMVAVAAMLAPFCSFAHVYLVKLKVRMNN